MVGTTCHRRHRSLCRSTLWIRQMRRHHPACRWLLHPTPRPKLCRQFHPLLLRRRARLLLCQRAHRPPCMQTHLLRRLLVHLRLAAAWPHRHCHHRALLHQLQQCPLHRGPVTEGMPVVCGAWPSLLCQKRSCRRRWTMLAARTEWIARRLWLEAAVSTRTTFLRMRHMRSIAIGRR